MGFLETYFLNPIRFEQGYNYYNTVAYAVIAYFALWLINKWFKQNDRKIDISLLFQVSPFILIAAVLRILVDKREVQRAAWNVSPGIYILIATVFFVSFGVSLLLKKKFKINETLSLLVIGASIFLGLIFASMPLRLINLMATGFIVSLFFLLAMSAHLVFERVKWFWVLKPLPFLAFASQLFDATITSFLVQFYGAVEKHPLPRGVMEFFGTGFAFYPLKIIVILLAIYVISKEVKDKSFRNLLLISIAILGLAQSLRNLIGFIMF